MKTFLNVAFTCLLFATCACSASASRSGTDELHVGVWLTTGERSKDSGSNTTTITVERDAIVWERSSSRDRRRGKLPLRKEFKLSPVDKEKLLQVIRSNNLLVTESLELPQDVSYSRYFRVSIELTVDGKKGSIKISGPRTAALVKEAKLYQNTFTLVNALYRIMASQDGSVHLEELILESVTPASGN